jgi:hypothetical protein
MAKTVGLVDVIQDRCAAGDQQIAVIYGSVARLASETA